PAAPIEPLTPAKIEREVAPAELPTPAERPAPPLAPSVLPPAPAAPRQTPQPLSTPDAGEEIFKSRRDTGPSPAEAPRINLDAARKKAAREIVSEGAESRGVFTIPSPPTLEPKSKQAMP